MPATAQRSIGRLLYLSLILATIAAGLLCRFSHIGLPPGIAKYGGSALWALMLYWLAALLLRRWQPFRLVIATGFFATAIEHLKLYHSPPWTPSASPSRAYCSSVASSPSGTSWPTGSPSPPAP